MALSKEPGQWYFRCCVGEYVLCLNFFIVIHEAHCHHGITVHCL